MGLTLALSSANPGCATTPATDFTDNGDGTATHKTTGLTWKRCAEGQSWSGLSCTGSAQAYTWAQAAALTASFAGKNDWRTPTIAELVSIIERDNFNPTINNTIFPITPASNFWSDSTYAANAGFAWNVYFNCGFVSPNDKAGSARVRLVRGGTSPAPSGYTPLSDFTDNGDGTVAHKKTGLIWKRCAEGQNWTGSACSGTASAYDWVQAIALGQTYAASGGWRLPNQNELFTIVEWNKLNPAINTTVFPNTPLSGFWSSSVCPGISGTAWPVNFTDGGATPNGKSYSYPVRLVRGKTTPEVSSASADCLFNWAEKAYPQYFAPASTPSQTSGVYYYRYYSGTQTHLGIANDTQRTVYIGPSGGGQQDLGDLAAWLETSGCK